MRPIVFWNLVSLGVREVAITADFRWAMKCRPTWSEELARPFGCLSLTERSNRAAELLAPQEATTTSALWISSLPRRSTTQATAPERHRRAIGEDGGRHVLGRPLGSAPTACLWAREGGRIRSAAACSGGSLSALTHDATRPAFTPLPRMTRTLASRCCALKRDGL
jgi:hypothetical protein